MGSSCAHYQNKLETKKQYLTTLLERIHGENPKKQKNIDKIKKTSRKPKKQKTKTFQRMFGLRLMFGYFWFCLVFFVFFGLDLEKTKKTQCVLVFLDKMMVKELLKIKKLNFFLGFWVFVALVSFWLRNEKPKKTLSFFGFSHFFKHHFIQKTKKPWIF